MLLAAILFVLIGQSHAARQLSSQSKALNSNERPNHRRVPIHDDLLPIHSNETVNNNNGHPTRRNESVNLSALHWSVSSRGSEDATSNSKLPGSSRSRRMKRHRRVKRAAKKKELQPLPTTVAAGGAGDLAGEGDEAEDIVTTPLLVAAAITKKTRSKTPAVGASVTEAGGFLGNATKARSRKRPSNRHSNASSSSNQTLEAPVVGGGEAASATEPELGGERMEAGAGAVEITTVSRKSAKGKKKKGKAGHATTTVRSRLQDGESEGEAENNEMSFATEKTSYQKTNSFGFPIDEIPANGIFEDKSTEMGYGHLETNESALHLSTTTHEPKSPTLLIVAAVVVSLVGVVAILVIGMVMYRYRAEIFGKGKEAPKPPTETAPLKTEKKPSDKSLKKTKDVAANVGSVLKTDAAAGAKPGAPPGPGTGPVPPGVAAAPAAPGAAGAPSPLSAFKPGITPSAPVAATGAAPSRALKPDGTPIGAVPAVPASAVAPSLATAPATTATSMASSAASDISGSASTGASTGSNISSAKS